MLKLHELLLTFFYFGNVRKAPGTIGSILAVTLWFLLSSFFHAKDYSLLFQNLFWFSFIVAGIFYGTYAIPIYGKSVDNIDHKSIVFDEVVGQILALQISFSILFDDYFNDYAFIIFHLLSSFVFFRFFDIAKPSLIGKIDRELKNGIGVMMDDIFAGIMAAYVVIIGWWIVM